MTVLDCLDEYKRLGGCVFGQPRRAYQLTLPIRPTRTKYDGKKLQNVVEDVVERRREHSDSRARFEAKQHTCQT